MSEESIKEIVSNPDANPSAGSNPPLSSADGVPYANALSGDIDKDMLTLARLKAEQDVTSKKSEDERIEETAKALIFKNELNKEVLETLPDVDRIVIEDLLNSPSLSDVKKHQLIEPILEVGKMRTLVAECEAKGVALGENVRSQIEKIEETAKAGKKVDVSGIKFLQGALKDTLNNFNKNVLNSSNLLKKAKIDQLSPIEQAKFYSETERERIIENRKEQLKKLQGA